MKEDRQSTEPLVWHETSSRDSGLAVSYSISEQTVFKQTKTEPRFAGHGLKHILKSTFLPVDYPNSVKHGYMEYQIYDSIQGMSSYLRGALSIKSVLQGTGVGSSEATALSAALMWVFKDGLGMIGSLIFAYFFADTFEMYTKEWRLLADILNNIGLMLDIISPLVPSLFFMLTSLSTLSKSLCWLIAGATKARISAYFAKDGYLADVTAKESTQETAICLVGLSLGMAITFLIGENDFYTWAFYIALTVVHQYANYALVRVISFDNLNPQRCFTLTRLSMEHVDSKSTAPCSLFAYSPEVVAEHWSTWFPVYMSICGPQLGASIGHLLESLYVYCKDCSIDGGARSILYVQQKLRKLWYGEKFLIGFDRTGRIVVCLEKDITDHEMTKAFMISCFLHIRLQSELGFISCLLSVPMSPDLLASRYNRLFANEGELASEALTWHTTCILPILLLNNKSDPKEKAEAELSALDAQAVHDNTQTGVNSSWNTQKPLLNPKPWRYFSSSANASIVVSLDNKQEAYIDMHSRKENIGSITGVTAKNSPQGARKSLRGKSPSTRASRTTRSSHSSSSSSISNENSGCSGGVWAVNKNVDLKKSL